MVATLERALRDPTQEHGFAAADALVGIALNDDDRDFVEHWCMQVGTRAVSGSPLLGLAALCLGHTARRFEWLSDEAIALVEALAARAEADPSDVSPQALDGRGDMRSYLRLNRFWLPWRFVRQLPTPLWSMMTRKPLSSVPCRRSR